MDSLASVKCSSYEIVEPSLTRKHISYYTPDGNVVIQVQDTLFKLDLSVLHAKSPVFRSIVPPVYAGKTRLLGFNDQHPFQLPEVSEIDFTRLLSVIYPFELGVPKPTTVDEWLSVLRLSSKYEIDESRQIATSHLCDLPINPIRRIAIWEEYHLNPDFLIPSYVQLCQLDDPLTLGMTMALGLKNFTKLSAARETYRKRLGCISCARHNHQDRRAIAEKCVTDAFGKTERGRAKTKKFRQELKL